MSEEDVARAWDEGVLSVSGGSAPPRAIRIYLSMNPYRPAVRNLRFGDHRLPDRFWANIRQTPDGCWEWTGSSYRGSGRIRMHGGPAISCRRVAFEALTGRPVGGHRLHATCETRGCCNPEHLRLAGE